MQKRTCILVTHAVDLCLPGSAFVVVMHHGIATASGAPGTIDATLKQVLPSLELGPPTIAEKINSEEDPNFRDIEQLKLVKEEKQVQGSMSAQAYLFYLRMLGGWWVLLVAILVYIVAQLAEIG